MFKLQLLCGTLGRCCTAYLHFCGAVTTFKYILYTVLICIVLQCYRHLKVISEDVFFLTMLELYTSTHSQEATCLITLKHEIFKNKYTHEI
jgi:hypothetical protein